MSPRLASPGPYSGGRPGVVAHKLCGWGSCHCSPGAVCTWVWSSWNESQHRQVCGLLTRNRYLITSECVECSCPKVEEFKYLGILFISKRNWKNPAEVAWTSGPNVFRTESSEDVLDDLLGDDPGEDMLKRLYLLAGIWTSRDSPKGVW